MALERGFPASSDLLTMAGAAALLGVSTSTLRRYVKLEWIQPAAVIGRSYVFQRAEVERFRTEGARTTDRSRRPGGT